MLTGQSGPLVVYGSRNPLGTGVGGSNNPDIAPSLFYGGANLFDPRSGYNVTKMGAIGMSGGESAVINAVPSAISAVNIAASQSPGASALTLVTVTGAGITVVSTATTVWASGNVIPVNALAIDGLPGLVSFGLASVSNGYTKVSMYDPTKSLARNVRITSGGNDSGISFLVSGADVYGYPQTESITGANAGVAAGKKAFKFIYSITPSGAAAGTVSVGTGDVFGLPLLSSFWGDIDVVWNNTWGTTPGTGYVAADTTSPATSTTGDVRGTVSVALITGGSASDGTKRLTVYVNPSINNLALGNAGLFGQTPA
jgi:hypothetical protein